MLCIDKLSVFGYIEFRSVMLKTAEELV